MREVKNHASRGGAVLGICNGFQILLEAKLLNGALIRNSKLKFACKEVDLKVSTNINSPFLDKVNREDIIKLPIADIVLLKLTTKSEAFPNVSIFMILLVSATLYHALLGVQVIVEDYIHHEGFKFLLLISLKFIFLVLGVIAVFSLLKIAL